jgi:N-methylhydantoinase A/oxoprolinase/acetone carboxylase beta subunit
VGNRLQTSVIIPEHADVANAIGAAVGEVMETVEVIIRPGKEHIGFIVHAPWEHRYFSVLDEAKSFAVNGAREAVKAMALASGGRKVEIIEFIDDHFTEIFGNQKSIYVETQVRITALGSPVWINPHET